MKPTHIRIKTGEKVFVTRHHDVVVVKNTKGKVLGSYERKDMAKFQKRYKSMVARKQI